MTDLFDFEQEEREEILDTSEKDAIADAKSMPIILSALDNNDYSYYDRFGRTPEEKSKAWTAEAYPAMRWLSSVGESKVDWAEAKRQGRQKGDKKGPWPSTIYDTELTAYFLIAVNEVANTKFWDYGDHKKLQFLVLACIGQGSLPEKQGHNWLKLPKTRRGKDVFEELLLKYYPDANSLEMKILKKKYSDDEDLIELCKKYAYDDNQIKKVIAKKDEAEKFEKG